MVYGDLHFKNIMIKENNDLILTDFGFCHMIKENHELDRVSTSYQYVLNNIVNFDRKGMNSQQIKDKMFEFHTKKLAQCWTEFINCNEGLNLFAI